jgi:hypothetical protein
MKKYREAKEQAALKEQGPSSGSASRTTVGERPTPPPKVVDDLYK